MVDRVGPALSLQAEGRPGPVGRPVLAGGAVQVVGGIQLEPRLGGEALQHQPAAGDPGRQSQGGHRIGVKGKVVVVPIA